VVRKVCKWFRARVIILSEFTFGTIDIIELDAVVNTNIDKCAIVRVNPA
tara:strand:- start:3211 stop:3357 length:147 start_codon:yes stop_codon:yes gene_type:complete